jgi:adenylate cyclase
MRPIAVQRLLAYAASIALCLALGAARAADPPPDVEALKRDAAVVRDSPQKALALAALSKLNWQTDQEAALKYANEGLAIGDRIGDDRARAANLNAIGAVHLLRGEYDAAQPLLERAVALNEATGNAKEAGRVAANLGHLHAARNDNDAALAAYARAAGLGERARDDAGLETVNDGIGNVLQAQGRYREAIAAFERSLDFAAKAGDEQSRAITLNNLANCLFEVGDAKAALENYLTAAQAFERLDLPIYQAQAYANIAPILAGQGMNDQATGYLERALAIQRRTGNRPAEGVTLLNLGVMQNEGGKLEAAVATYETALALFRNLGDRKNEATILHNLGKSYAELGRRDDGLRYLGEALALREAIGDARGAASTRIAIGAELVKAGRVAAGTTTLTTALAEAKRLEVPELEAEARAQLYEAAKRAGRPSVALEHLAEYVALRDRLLNASSQEKVAEMQARYESERSAREIEVLQRDKAIQALELRRQELWRNGLIVASLLLAVLAAVFVSRYRLKKRAEAVLRDKNRELEIAHREVALERDRSEQLLLNVLPPSIAGRLKDRDATIADRYAEATILFADLVEFTRLAQRMDAESVVRMLNDVFTRFDALTDRYGLEKIKTIGDCYMAVGGVPERRDDHCAAVASMALDMIRELEAFNAAHGHALRLRIGINTGEVVAGVIGRKKFIYDLWGDAVNMASRMESHGEPSRIQVTQAVVDAIGDRFVFEARGQIEVKGRGAMTTFFLIGPKA